MARNLYFAEVYHLSDDRYINNVDIAITQWDDCFATAYRSDGTYEKHDCTTTMAETHTEPLEAILEIEISGTCCAIKGFGTISQAWLEYRFVNPTITVTQREY